MIVAIDPLGRLIYFGDAVVVDDVIVAVAGGGVALGSCACVNTCLFPSSHLLPRPLPLLRHPVTYCSYYYVETNADSARVSMCVCLSSVILCSASDIVWFPPPPSPTSPFITACDIFFVCVSPPFLGLGTAMIRGNWSRNGSPDQSAGCK